MSDGEVLRNSFCSYPKLWALGHGAIGRIFDTDVIVEEKIDGSQFSFGVFSGELRCRSKSVAINMFAPEKMFLNAVRVAKELHESGVLKEGYTYRTEYLNSPKHNSLAYQRIPLNHLMGFDVSTGFEEFLTDEEKREELRRIGIEVVPQLFRGKVNNPQELRNLLENISVLGGQLIEGVVVKNYNQRTSLGQISMGKLVSEAFKEVHQADWKERGNEKKDFIETLIYKYRTPARWNKAIQHLKEKGQLLNDPKDIGPLIKEVNTDVETECAEELREAFYNWGWPQVARGLTHGLPQWYKEELLKSAFNETDNLTNIGNENGCKEESCKKESCQKGQESND